MTGKSYFEEFYSVEEYDRELNKILIIDDPMYAALFYHAVSKSIFVKDESTISIDGYDRLCDYLLVNLQNLPDSLKGSIKEDDLKSRVCTLIEKDYGEVYQPGTHYFDASMVYLEELEDNMLTDFTIESWEEYASAD